MPQRRPAAEVDAFEVDVLNSLPGRQFGGLDQVVLGRGDAGVVEGDVHRAVGRRRGVKQVVHRRLVGDVDGDEGSLEFLRHPLPGLRVDVTDHDDGPLGPQPAGGRQPDTAGPAGDDGDPAGQALGQVDLGLRGPR